jgi:3',5'-nucleoside bisphosphate phosphatase
MKNVDLHVHSYYSDGEESPGSLLLSAINMGFKIFSIADHNYISPDQNQLLRLAKDRGLLYLQGVEISCFDKETDESLHILGYSTFFDIERINRRLQPIVDGYNERAKKIIAKLNLKYGADFDYTKIKNEIPSVCISRNYLAQKLSVFLGGARSPKELLPEVFVEEDHSWMPDAKTAIDFIRGNNGMAILAHPGNLIAKGQFENLLERLIIYGLQGIEVYYPKHTAEIAGILKKTAEKYNLLITAGSDWHGREFSQDHKGMLIPDGVYGNLSNMFTQKKYYPFNALLPLMHSK